MRSLRRVVPRALPHRRAVTHRRSWSGCTSTTRAAPRLPAHRRPLCPEIEAGLGETIRAAQRSAAAPPVAGADPAPRCAAWSRLGGRAVRLDLLPGDDPRRPASLEAVLEEEAARPGQS